MRAAPEVVRHDDGDTLAAAVAERLVARLLDLQDAGRVPSVVLTGGTIAEKLHRAVVTDPRSAQVDWARVDFWFGDERYVPAGDPDRNAGQARAAMLDHLPVDPERVHEMPASDGEYGDDVDAAAAAYAARLGAAPAFDVLMLGVGPDGHCASMFPGHPALSADGVAVAVRDSPKPPPTRISLTMGTLGRADEVWFVASGEGKADAVRDALADGDVVDVPAAGPKGRTRTLWLVDDAAASHLPR